MEKQIEEMAKEMCDCCRKAVTNDTCEETLCWGVIQHAEALYNAGYRKQEWISVEDMIPKKWQKCLCYYPEKDYGSKVVVDYAETDNGGFAEQFQFGKPSHWMPLPEAPKMKGGAE